MNPLDKNFKIAEERINKLKDVSKEIHRLQQIEKKRIENMRD